MKPTASLAVDKNRPYERTSAHSRIDAIDLLRGAALLGILLVHCRDHFNCYIYVDPAMQTGWLNTLDGMSNWFVSHFLGGKAMTLFSLLFGISFFIQLDRAEARGVDFRLRFIWRLILLAAFGVIHSVFYAGDILVSFAVQGVLIVPFYRAKTATLLLAATFFLVAIPLATWLIKHNLSIDYLFSYEWESRAPSREEVLLNGSFSETAQWNLTYGQSGKWKYFIEHGRILENCGLFLVGLFLGRTRFFERIGENKRYLPLIILATFPLWLLTTIINNDITRSIGNLFYVASFATAICLVYLKYQKAKLFSWPIAAGKVTLTAYITQSLFFTFLFYGWGLRMASSTGIFYSLLLGLAFFCVQAVVSKYWLSQFRYGPLEWLWRTATHTRRQPIKKTHF